jgi:hypothetical protein
MVVSYIVHVCKSAPFAMRSIAMIRIDLPAHPNQPGSRTNSHDNKEARQEPSKVHDAVSVALHEII